MPASSTIPALPRLAALVLTLAAAPASAQDTAPRLDVPYVPTPEVVVDRMLAMAGVGKGDFVIDLGSGDGRIPVTAAKRFGVKALGVDLNPQRIQEANENAVREGVTDLVEFRQQNLFETDIRPATVLTMYLLSRVNLDLRPRILSDLRPGTRVVSHAFNMGEWQPDEEASVEGRRVYKWIVPAKVDGRWRMEADGTAAVLEIRQEFQRIWGTAEVNGQQAALQDAKLAGPTISFAVDTGSGRRTFTGTVEGGEIRGEGGWKAARP